MLKINLLRRTSVIMDICGIRSKLQELSCFSEMPLEIHSLVQNADNQYVALRAERIEDYVMSAMESVQVRHNFFILFGRYN